MFNVHQSNTRTITTLIICLTSRPQANAIPFQRAVTPSFLTKEVTVVVKPRPDTCIRVFTVSMGCVKLTVKTHAAPPNAIDSKRFGVLTFGVAMVLQSRRYDEVRKIRQKICCIFCNKEQSRRRRKVKRKRNFVLAGGGRCTRKAFVFSNTAKKAL